MVVSAISRKVFVALIRKIKFQRQSIETSVSIYWTLLVFFCNYGLMYLIAPLNFIDGKQVTSDGDALFSGYYSDFSSEWFLDIGASLLQTHVINAIFPLAEFLLLGLVRLLRRCID